ncbi:hypothetical protein ACLHDD_02335 [Pantoea sp. NSTU24]|uniref:hypothetical protein n=1 Tax=Pantoea sp. NSTU24 TaxID=3391144 RepID=UPI003CFF1778
MLFIKIRNPNIIFIIFSLSCMFFVFLSFKSWNYAKPFTSKFDTYKGSSLKYSIDMCSKQKSSYQIRGWFFADDFPKKIKTVVTIDTGKKEFVIPSLTYVRDDVNQVFSRNNDFENSGFNASLYLPISNEISNYHYNFYIMDKHGDSD